MTVPFAGYETFDACVIDQTRKGHSDESAHKICGRLQADLERGFKMNTSQLSAQIGSYDPGTRSVPILASTTNEVDGVALKKWDLSRFQKNPVILWAHDASKLPVGLARDVEFSPENGLTMRVVFGSAAANPLAEQLAQCVHEGLVRAVSVGYTEDGDTAILDEVSFVSIGLDEDAGTPHIAQSHPANAEVMRSIAMNPSDEQIRKQHEKDYGYGDELDDDEEDDEDEAEEDGENEPYEFERSLSNAARTLDYVRARFVQARLYGGLTHADALGRFDRDLQCIRVEDPNLLPADLDEALRHMRLDAKAYVVQEHKPDGSVKLHDFGSKKEASLHGMAMRTTNPKVFIFEKGSKAIDPIATRASPAETHATLAAAHAATAAAISPKGVGTESYAKDEQAKHTALAEKHGALARAYAGVSTTPAKAPSSTNPATGKPWAPGDKIKVTQTPIASWASQKPSTSPIVLTKTESEKTGTTYAYRGNGSSGGVQAKNDEEAIAHIEKHELPMHSTARFPFERVPPSSSASMASAQPAAAQPALPGVGGLSKAQVEFKKMREESEKKGTSFSAGADPSVKSSSANRAGERASFKEKEMLEDFKGKLGPEEHQALASAHGQAADLHAHAAQLLHAASDHAAAAEHEAKSAAHDAKAVEHEGAHDVSKQSRDDHGRWDGSDEAHEHYIAGMNAMSAALNLPGTRDRAAERGAHNASAAEHFEKAGAGGHWFATDGSQAKKAHEHASANFRDAAEHAAATGDRVRSIEYTGKAEAHEHAAARVPARVESEPKNPFDGSPSKYGDVSKISKEEGLRRLAAWKNEPPSPVRPVEPGMSLPRTPSKYEIAKDLPAASSVNKPERSSGPIAKAVGLLEGVMHKMGIPTREASAGAFEHIAKAGGGGGGGGGRENQHRGPDGRWDGELHLDDNGDLHHFDFMALDLQGRFDGKLERLTRTQLGGATVPARLSRTGVLKYRNPDGTIRRELRLASEIFKADSLRTLEHAPVIDIVDHTRMVTPSTFRHVSLGHAINVRQEGNYIIGDLVIQDQGTLDAIERGERTEISCGYRCTLDMTPGVYEGEPYDCVQRDIRYNHAALCPPNRGRAGPEVGLRL